jgi:hypothetical protein
MPRSQHSSRIARAPLALSMLSTLATLIHKISWPFIILFGGSAAPRGRCVFSIDRNALCCCALPSFPPFPRVSAPAAAAAAASAARPEPVACPLRSSRSSHKSEMRRATSLSSNSISLPLCEQRGDSRLPGHQPISRPRGHPSHLPTPVSPLTTSRSKRVLVDDLDILSSPTTLPPPVRQSISL